MNSVPELACRIVATRAPDTRVWEFCLVNDGETEIEAAVLEAVKYEWGDRYMGGDSPQARVINLPPGAQARIWTDDGRSEMRTDLWVRVTHRGTESWLLFEFPKLYRQIGNTLVAHPQRMPGAPSD